MRLETDPGRGGHNVGGQVEAGGQGGAGAEMAEMKLLWL